MNSVAAFAAMFACSALIILLAVVLAPRCEPGTADIRVGNVLVAGCAR